MRGFKEPTFQERVALAQQAKNKALQKLKNKPPIDEAELARKAEQRLVKEAAAAEKRAAMLAAKEVAKAEKTARLAADAAAIEAAKPPVLTEAERKAARDARYAARKNRK